MIHSQLDEAMLQQISLITGERTLTLKMRMNSAPSMPILNHRSLFPGKNRDNPHPGWLWLRFLVNWSFTFADLVQPCTLEVSVVLLRQFGVLNGIALARFLFLLILLPFLIGIYIWYYTAETRFVVRYSSLSLIMDALPKHSRLRRHLPFAIFSLALLV